MGARVAVMGHVSAASVEALFLYSTRHAAILKEPTA